MARVPDVQHGYARRQARSALPRTAPLLPSRPHTASVHIRPGVSLLFGALLLLVCVFPAHAADSLPLRIGVFTAVGDSVPEDRLLGGAFDEQFLPAPPGPIHFSGGDYTHWLRIEVEAGAAARPAREAVRLVLPRVMASGISISLPRRNGLRDEHSDGFFRPQLNSDPLPSNFNLPLPADLDPQRPIYIALISPVDLRLAPALVPEEAARRDDLRNMLRQSAGYVGLVLVTAFALILLLAMRVRDHALLALFALLLLATLLAWRGHLYLGPLAPLLAWAGPGGVFALALVTAATGLLCVLQTLDLRQSAPQQYRRFGILALALAALGTLSLFWPRVAAVGLQWIGAVGAAIALLALLMVGLSALLRGQRGALWVTLAGLALALGMGLELLQALHPDTARAGLIRGDLPLLVGCLLLLVAQTGQLASFRLQRDQAARQMQQVDATLQLEQRRREFSDGLREAVRNAPVGGDLEWLVFKKLLQGLLPLLPQQSSAVVLSGYRGRDLLLAEPLATKVHYQRLLTTRGTALRGVCRTRSPVQVRFEDPGLSAEEALAGGQFAVLPLAVARPGWGAVLLERAAHESFGDDELKLASEFCRVAVECADASAEQYELKRKAEIDPVTGTLNQRAGEEHLRTQLGRAIADRRPLCVVRVAVDHVKTLVERHTHAGVDQALAALAEAVRRELGDEDELARCGPADFLLILPGRPSDQARQLAEQIRLSVAKLRLEGDRGQIRFSVSLGVAGRLGAESEGGPLIERAARALALAQRNAGNQVQVASAYGAGAEQDGVSL